jgi:glycosyltransferase involved in cell wall biosynthesis
MSRDRTTRTPPPLVSIVVPAFDCDRYLEEALHSIRAQASVDYEVVVVDDGSARSPEPILRAVFPQATYIRQENRGPAAARNVAIEVARGSMIAFLDADDVWPDTALASLLKGAAYAPAAGVVQGAIRRFHEVPEGDRTQRSHLGHAYFSFNVGAILVRREALLRTGLFNEALRQSEDVDLHIRFKDCGVRKLVIPDTVLHYRRHPDAMNERRRPPVLTSGHQGNWLRLLEDSLERRRRGADAAERGLSLVAPEVSVALVVRDGRQFLPAALASIRRQSVGPSEILAIVGPSTDGTLDYLEAQPGVNVRRQEGEGLAEARNQAVSLARHDLIAFLDCDDIWHPAKLKAQLDALSTLPGAAYSVTSFARAPAGIDPAARPDRLPFEDIRIGLTPSALLAHRSVFERLRGFDAALGFGCDSDWFYRAMMLGIPCAVASQILMYKGIHAGNLSRSPLANRNSMFEILRKNRS